MKIKKLLTISLVAFTMSFMSVILSSSSTFAASETTLTWTGDSCNTELSEANCKWSLRTNWKNQDGDVPTSNISPVAEDDELYLEFDIDNITGVYRPTNDIPNLIVDGISFTRSKTTELVEGYNRVRLSSDVAPILSLRGDIINDTPDEDGIYEVEISGNIKLLTDSTFSRISSIPSASADVPASSHTSSVDLNGHVLEIEPADTTFNLNRMRITGNGGVVYLSTNTLSGHEVYEKNTYTGKTDIYGYVRGTVSTDISSFGSSTIELHNGSKSRLYLGFDGDVVAFNNKIIMHPRTSIGDNDYSEIIFKDSQDTVKLPNRTIKVPNIELKGHVYMDNFQWDKDDENSYIVDLNGIKSNDFPIQYGGGSINKMVGFINGPLYAAIVDGVETASTQSGDTTGKTDTKETTATAKTETTDTSEKEIKAPDTSIGGLLLANPIMTLAMGLISSMVLIGAFKRKFNQ